MKNKTFLKIHIIKENKQLSSDESLLKRLTKEDKDMFGVNDLLKIGFIPIVSAQKKYYFPTIHSFEARKRNSGNSL